MRRLFLLPAAAFAALLALPAPPASAQLTSPLDSATMEQLRWRSIGPTNMGGRVTDVEGIPGPSRTFYVAAAAGGIWKTTNNGITFRPLFDDQRVIAMGDIAIAPSDTLQIWAGTGEEDSRNSISAGGGVYKSVDGGMTWELMGLEETEVVGRIVVHPENPDVVYVAALGHIWGSNPERGLYRTTDGGETWELIKFISDEAGFVDIAMHPEDPDVIFASSWERVRGPYFLDSGGPGSALWKTTDGGDTWTEVEGNGFPTTMKGRIGLAISESSPDVMYALVEAEEEEDGSGGNGLYRSEDGGVTWEKRAEENSRPFYYSQVRIDPTDPDRVYWSSTPVQVSPDGGKTVGTTTIGIHVDHHALWIDPHDPDRMVAGNDGGVAITYDKGGNWRYLNTMPLGQFYHVSYNMDVPYRVCGGLQDNGTWCGPSRVEGGEINNYHWATISGGDGFYTAQDPEDPDLVWSESQGGNMGRVNMATGERTSLEKPGWEEKWRPHQDTIVTLMKEGVGEDNPRIRELQYRATRDSMDYSLRWNWSTPFFQSGHDRSHFYAAANKVLKSTDRGDGLDVISPDLTYADTMKIRVSTQTTGGITPDVTGAETHATIVALAESPLRQGWLFAGTDDGRVWTTRDDGGSWTELTDRFEGVPHGTWVSRIEPSHHDAERFYVTFDGHRTNDFTPYVYVTDDGGGSFRSIASDLPTGKPDFVHVVREDPHNEHLLFVGTDVGVYVSTDRGERWQRFMTGLPTTPVHDLKIHPRDRELIAGTHGRSIWIVDIEPLEHLTDRAMVADGAVLFEPTPAFQWGMEARGGESYGQAWFDRPTPGSEAEIGYWVGEELAGKLAAEAGEAAEGEGGREGMMDREEGERARMRRGGEEEEEEEEEGEGVEAGEEGEGAVEGTERRGPPAGMRGRRGGGGPQATITITGPDGEVLRELTGPATAGLHKVTWNFRGEQPEAEPLSPSEKRDSARVAERVEVVADSLMEAGWEEAPLRRMLGLFTGETDRQAMFRRFRGGARGGGDPEAFRERPGENIGGGGGGPGFDFGQMRELADLVAPGQGLGSLFRGRGGAQAEMAEPGGYTVTLKVGDLEYTAPLQVERMGELSGESSPFDEEGEGFVEWLREGGR